MNLQFYPIFRRTTKIMYRLEKYIINNLSTLFVSIFLPLFAIATVILFIKIATYTAIIQLSLTEMFYLYLFYLPQIIFYTLPVTFFVATTLSLFKLSNDNEIIVLFSLGIKPIFLLKILFKPALLLSVTLFTTFLIVIPHMQNVTTNFMAYKKGEAKFNFTASEFGNRFGNWFLYISANHKDGSYADVFLFSKHQTEEKLISAKRAEIFNDNGILRLKLFDGQGYTYSNTNFSQINFKTMLINNNTHTDYEEPQNVLEHWKKYKINKSRKTDLITNTLLSVFPLLTLLFAAAIGIGHARHGKPKIYLYLFLIIISYYGATIGLGKAIGFYVIPFISIISLIGSYLIYRKKITRRF